MIVDGLSGVRGQVSSMDEAIAQMTALSDGLAADDGVAVFTTMYLHVTQLVAEQVGESFFAAPDFLARLDVVFANRFLGALAAAREGAPVAACWRVLLERRHDRHLHPLQFALMGMNAHINHDLVVALNDVFAEQGLTPHDSAARGDFTRVNELLATLEPKVRASLFRQASSRLGTDVGHVEDCLGRWSIARARAVAWHDAAVLWDVRDHPHLVHRMTASLDRAAAAAARCLGLPLSSHRGAGGDCGCEEQRPALVAAPMTDVG